MAKLFTTNKISFVFICKKPYMTNKACSYECTGDFLCTKYEPTVRQDSQNDISFTKFLVIIREE